MATAFPRFDANIIAVSTSCLLLMLPARLLSSSSVYLLMWLGTRYLRSNIRCEMYLPYLGSALWPLGLSSGLQILQGSH